MTMILLAQIACKSANTVTPEVMPTQAATEEAPCPSPTAETSLLTNTDDGYCLLYPAGYSTDIPHYIVINPISSPDVPGEAWMSIAVEAVSGRTAAQVADERIASVGTGFNISRFEVTLDGEQAIVVDGLPGPDPLRAVFVVHADRLYTLTFMPWAPNPADPTLLENLYKMVMDTFHFLP